MLLKRDENTGWRGQGELVFYWESKISKILELIETIIEANVYDTASEVKKVDRGLQNNLVGSFGDRF